MFSLSWTRAVRSVQLGIATPPIVFVARVVAYKLQHLMFILFIISLHGTEPE